MNDVRSTPEAVFIGFAPHSCVDPHGAAILGSTKSCAVPIEGLRPGGQIVQRVLRVYKRLLCQLRRLLGRL